ncbi:MAG: hypothetical protein Q8O03_02400 [Nanoarchaeota archaeon]|nr:hypothetical protein [Nanoarchaeota archaeon]
MYKDLFIKSWKDLKNNPILLLPDTVMFLLNMALGIFFLKSSGILGLATDPAILSKQVSTMLPVIKLFIKENLLKLIISFALFILTSFLVGSGLVAMKLGMMKDLLEKQELSFKKMLSNGRYVGQVISMKMIMFIIGAVTFLFVIGTGVILSTFLFKGQGVLVTTLLSPVLIILLQLSLLFRYQIMFSEKKHTITAVKESFEYFIKNKKHVFLVWLIAVAMAFITAPIGAFLGLTDQTKLSMMIVLFYILRSVTGVVIGVWSDMFKFRTYKLKL